MDTNRAINTAILSYLLADTTLKTTMGNTNIRVGENVRLDEFPYMSFSINSSGDRESSVIMNGTVEFHLWDKRDLTAIIQEMRGRLIKLLDRQMFTLTGGEAKGVRLYYDSDGIVIDQEEFYHHIVMLFTIKYARSGDLNI